ncbi:MAG: MFS transporter [Bacteroidota bacterium]
MINRFIKDKESFLAFRFIDYRRFIFSKFMLTLALQIQFVVISWQVYQLTHDFLALGLLGLFEAIPAVTLALFGGYISDRNDRQKIVFIIMMMQMLCSTALVFISYHYTSNPGEVETVFPYYVIMFFVGLLRGFYSPAQFPLMTQLVPREAYANSSAWNSTFWHIAVVVGSSIGGLLLAFFGANVVYIIVVFCLLLGVVQIYRIPPQPPQSVKQGESVKDSITQGLSFVFKNQMIFGAMLLDLIAVLFGGATAMLPVFASEVLHVGETGFGILRAAPFVGSVVMALYMTRYPPLKNSGKKLLACVAGFSLCMIFFALSKNFYLSFAILVLSGAFDNVSVVIRSMIVQFFTPDEMRGRVSSVSTMFISSSNEIGAFESGFAAKLIGLVPSVVIGGGVAILSVGGAFAWLPELRKLDLQKEMKSER